MIDVRNLSVTYPDGTKALKDLSFHIKKGSCTALVGTNGAGKSTLLLSLVGIVTPDSGEMFINGLRVERKNLNTIRSIAGMVFQNPDDQLFMARVCDDLAFGPSNYGIDEDKVAKRVDKVLADLKIEGLKHRMPNKLSGGEKRLASLGSVLTMEPELLLLDEPTSFLDPRSRRNLISVLRELPQTKLIATHDLDMALDLCDNVIVLSDNILFAQGDPNEVLLNEQLMQDCGLELPLSCQ